MSWILRVAMAATVLAASSWAWAQPPASRFGQRTPPATLSDSTTTGSSRIFEPRHGYLLLRNIHLLEGHISRVGDQYVIAVSKTGEVRVPVQDVETICDSPEEAYFYLRRQLTEGRTARRGDRLQTHVRLAEWCLRNDLLEQAAEEILLIGRQDSDHPALGPLNRRVETALERRRQEKTTPPATAVRQASGTAPLADSGSGPISGPISGTGPLAGPKRASVEPTPVLEDLPPSTVQHYTSLIQPMLLNKCATNRCHGSGSTSDFKLIYPTWTKLMPQRFTQRNLSNVLAQIHVRRPETSPLLATPLRPHGGESLPVFGPTEQSQFESLARWVDQVLGPARQRVAAEQERQPAGSPETFDERVRAASFEMDTRPTTGDRTSATSFEDSAPGNGPDETARPNSAPPSWDITPSGFETFRPRDPFDPEIFNRRYFPPAEGNRSD